MRWFDVERLHDFCGSALLLLRSECEPGLPQQFGSGKFLGDGLTERVIGDGIERKRRNRIEKP